MSIPTVRQLIILAVLLVSSAAFGVEIEITGSVLGRSGGLAEARVEIQPLLPVAELAAQQLAGQAEPTAVAHTRTDRDGVFRLAAPGPGFWRIIVRHADYLPARYDLSPLVASRTLVALEMQRRSELIARVTDDAGVPLAGVSLVARGWSGEWRQSATDGWWPADRRTSTREDGAAVIPCASLEKVSVAALEGGRFVYQVADCGLGLLELQLMAFRQARVLHASRAPAGEVYGLLRWPLVAFGVTGEDGGLRGPFDWRDAISVVFADAHGYYGEPRRVGPGGGENPDKATVEAEDEAAGEAEHEAGVEILMLPPSMPIAGQVIDAFDERPVAKAWLWVTHGTHHHQVVERGGRFAAHLPTAHPADGMGVRSAVRFGAPGYLTSLYTPTTEEAVNLVVRLSPAMSLRGRIVDGDGVGIAGAEIRRGKPQIPRLGTASNQLQGTGRWVLGEIAATSGEGGDFELTGLAPATPFELRVTRSGFAVHHHRVPGLDPEQPREEILIVLDAGRSAFGLVLSEQGMPIAGAEVALLPSLTGDSAEQDFEVKDNFGASTDAEGAFALYDLPLGTYYLAAKSKGFPELLVPGIEVAAGEPPLDFGTVVLAPGILLSGRVVDHEGEAVAGANLSIRNADGEQIVVQRAGSPWFAAATSRQNGSFHFEGLPRASRLAVLVSADGYLPQSLAVTTGEEDQELTIELSAGVRVTGVVHDARGGLASHAEVSASSGPGLRRLSKWISRSAEADSEGRFEIAGLPPGDYDLVAESGPQRSDPVRRTLTIDGEALVHLQLREKASLAVLLRDPEGGPVSQGLVRATPLEESKTGDRRSGAYRITDPLGSAVLEPLEGGAHLVRANHPDFEITDITVEVPARGVEHVELTFERRRLEQAQQSISGRVVDPAGLPVAGARVSLASASRTRFTMSQPDGRFELASPAGEQRLNCRHTGFASYVGSPFEVGEGGVADRLIQLQEGVDIVGQVTGLEPEDLARLVIVARGPFEGEDQTRNFGHQYGVINFAGELRIPDLSAGKWMVRAELLNPTRSAATWIEIGRGEGEVEVDLHFEDGYRLSGSVLWLGRPHAGSTVSIRCDGEFRGETFSDTEGRFAIDHVPAGHCTLSSTDAERGVRARQQLEVTFDAEVILEMVEPVGGSD